MEYGAGRKRGNTDFANGNGGFKKSKQETESFPSGIGSKLKPCTKFFSTTGCQFGEGCHFLHYVPGGIKAVTQMLGNNPALPSGPRNQMGPPPPSFPDGSSPPAVKSRLCTKFNTAEGCRFGDTCRFAHGEWELGKPTAPQFEDPRGMGPPSGGRFGRPMMDQQPSGPGHAAAANFGASATAKISVDGSLAGAIIGKGGVNTKQICRLTGAKLAIRDHESDPNLKNIEMEGTFDQIKQASGMVRELIVSIGSGGPGHGGPPPMRNPSMPFFGGGGGGSGGRGGGGRGGGDGGRGGGGGGRGGGRGGDGGGGGGGQSYFKTRLCENFTKGSCTFGDRCHFAHGAEELRKGEMGM